MTKVDLPLRSKKDILAGLFARFGVNSAVRLLRSLPVSDLRVIAYHRICDTDEVNDAELVSASVREFDWQVRHIKQHYHPFTFEQAAGCLAAGTRLPRNALIITFDDGFADNYLNAFRVLREYGVPATFFISTGYIGGSSTFWFNGVARMINRSACKTFEILSETIRIPKDYGERCNIVFEVLELLKQVSDESRHEWLARIAQQLEFIDDCDPLALPMSWDNVREMDAGGMEIGSHTISHPILTQLSGDRLGFEIRESKQEIESQLGKEIHSISYPEGMVFAFSDQVVAEVERAGYAFGATYVPGTNYDPRKNRFLLRRAHIERYVSRDRFAALLAWPELFESEDSA